MDQSLTDNQRGQIHDFALEARRVLVQEARELLEGTYGLYADGRLDPPEKLPQVRTDPETAETYRRLKTFLDDEVRAGLDRDEAVEKLVKEIAYTHLNRLVAFKMMEARKLIRGTLDKGTESNAFKFYLADPDHAADLALYQQGEQDAAYRHFLLWQAGQVAQEVRVLFDPDNLVSRLFPRPAALNRLLAKLNEPDLEPAWAANETIGWIYEYFSEPERAEWGQRQGEKIPPEIIPYKTQLYTPEWVIQLLVQNTLGQLWLEMHPDSRLQNTALLNYHVVKYNDPVTASQLPRLAEEIAVLDPACGTMHFGLVAFDLLHAMYAEELERAGEQGWPERPSVANKADIPVTIISRNLYGIDIDLRAVQLSALALYLKAKSYNKDAVITDSNLAVAGVLPLNGDRLGTFLHDARFTRPVYERLLRALWQRLQDARQLGSLLRLEQDLSDLIEAERERYEKSPLFAGIAGEFETAAADDAFWESIGGQIKRSLHEFAQQQADVGHDQAFFVGEAVKGMRLLELMQRKYDVVLTNPPYLDSRDFNEDLKRLLGQHYPDSKRNLYSAFTDRCLEFLNNDGRLGIITGQSFMFISSFETFRQRIQSQYAIETLQQFDYGLFENARMDTVSFVVRAGHPRPKETTGTYFRLVHAPDGTGKRLAFEQALQDGSNTYHVAQSRFEAIPGAPWAYWVSDEICQLFEMLPSLGDVAQPRQGLATADNFRFLRFWWEVGLERIGRFLPNAEEALASAKRWFPYMKGGPFRRWYGNQEHVVNWHEDGIQIKEHIVNRYPYLDGNWGWVAKNTEFYFREGLTWGDLNVKGFAVRYSPGGFIFDVKGSSGFPAAQQRLPVMGIMNSDWSQYALGILNPTASFQVGDISRVPLIPLDAGPYVALSQGVLDCIRVRHWEEMVEEATYDFCAPIALSSSRLIANAINGLAISEKAIQSEIYRLYGIDNITQAEIFKELNGSSTQVNNEGEVCDDNEESTVDELESAIDTTDLATRWISYATGIILGRFSPGTPGALGRAVYHRDDFAIGSLPAPDNAAFDELVGPPAQFAYIDEDGGRHVFPAAIEQALRDLAVPDGITVLDEGHPRDLPALVDKALRLMLGDEQAREIIDEAAGGDLRKFLERDYFTKWHLKWYRKRPVYWPIQSARRSYGFVLFHEQIDDQTFYTLQRDYLDAKLNGLRLHIEDLRGQAAGQSGAALKRIEREIDQTTQQLEEITDFAGTMERIVRDGYRPQPDWIDDGVILRMAPLWELIPIWKAEPKKYWERLEKGDYDWSHIAMAYWPDRVREACKTNKSFAIAHGHESWYEGE